MAACTRTRGAFIVAAKRTPFGTFGGKLRAWSATELGVVACRGALEAGNVPLEAVDSVVVGNVNQVGNGDLSSPLHSNPLSARMYHLLGYMMFNFCILK